MRYKVKELLRVHYGLTEHQINMALIGKANELSEAYSEGIAPEAVADSIYGQYKKEAGL